MAMTYPLWMSLIPFVTLLFLIIGGNAVYAFARNHKKSAPLPERQATAKRPQPRTGARLLAAAVNKLH